MTRESELNWFKSSYSGSNDNDCVEVAAAAGSPTTVHVRDSKNPHRPHLGFAAPAWAAFVPYASER
ncbi:DUF397 domain-containing protein [Streptomyces paludis]|uniref:DUF397 domain-containing protein n=1 Tax=Streptomyces paludis TaxID=2282738 RepID=A0A345HNP6_9ACTN|nr:DUF397 domain-containing protein [Streptomyces paludis]AXG78320.1 DUF397 domain-containing protein [Streptomyces paludis]